MFFLFMFLKNTILLIHIKMKTKHKIKNNLKYAILMFRQRYLNIELETLLKNKTDYYFIF
jgi:hypothetical protein